MPGLLGYLAAGAAEGVGTSMLDQARAKREAALEELRVQREMDFRRGEREAGQAFTSSENEKTRAQAREMGGDVVRLQDGSSGVRRGSQVQPLTGADGKPVNVAGSAKDQPADVATAEWMIEKGVAKDYNEAWGKIKAGKVPPTTPADIEKMVEDAVDTEFSGGYTRPTPEQVEESRQRNRARILKNLGAEGGTEKSAHPPAPRDVSQREVGKVYVAPDGRNVEWTGKGWKVVNG